jgi:hypothetical protein
VRQHQGVAQGGESCQLLESWQLSPPSRAFKNLFIAYAMPFSIRYKRTGSLFQKPFKRRLVSSDRYFAALVRYIHHNPEKHGLVADFRDWPWSSYGAMLEEGTGTKMPTFGKLASLCLRPRRDDVLAQFGGRAASIALHQTEPDERTMAVSVIHHPANVGLLKQGTGVHTFSGHGSASPPPIAAIRKDGCRAAWMARCVLPIPSGSVTVSRRQLGPASRLNTCATPCFPAPASPPLPRLQRRLAL